MSEIALTPRLATFITSLPDPAGARLFAERLAEEQSQTLAQCRRNEEIYANILTLAAYSPLLAETMLQHREYITWLERERDLTQIKSKERLMEELARFTAMNSTLDESVRLARFKRRELLRIYLRDCLKLATLSETTEELSHLADAALERALQFCYQPLLVRYGTPQTLAEHGRLVRAEFAIIALGKLGSRELNYSSDIDLIFIYSADGETAGARAGAIEVVTNKFFFTKLAEAIVKTIGAPFGEGAVFRVDLRLRPHGRQGDLVINLAEALRYYQTEAQNWERQALVRARVAAGDTRLVENFLTGIDDQIFRPEPLIEALRDVRLAKEKIDSHRASLGGGYHVKLGPGGIREIEFIVQALQICYGGRDAWLRAPQTLIGLQRLADKNLLSDTERTHLTQAYNFLRTVEHRLQMEQGLQKHNLPQTPDKLALLARRCGYPDSATFEDNLQLHRQHVSAIYQRVFSQTAETLTSRSHQPSSTPVMPVKLVAEVKDADIDLVKRLFQEVLTAILSLPGWELNQTDTAEALVAGLENSLNKARTLKRVRSLVLSAATETAEIMAGLTAEQLKEMTLIADASHHFTNLLSSHIYLIKQLGGPIEPPLNELTRIYLYRLFYTAITDTSYDEALVRLRRCWYQLMIKIGRHDLLTTPSSNNQQAMLQLRLLNQAQTALAEAALDIACEMACVHTQEHYQRTTAPLIYTILGLGRLGHCGIDYDSDLDIVFVYNDESGDVAEQVTNQQFYARVVETIVHILSALTREGSLYRIDLRLRPEGRNGLLATSYENLQHYLKERAAIWELMAYLKMRSIAGDREFGRRAEDRIMELVFARGHTQLPTLAHEAHEMRLRLQAEKARAQTNNYKFAAGGMLDVYFATRYLQLRHAVPDPVQRGTLPLIEHLAHGGILSAEQARVFQQGYSFLRQLDHQVRLQLERPQPELPHNPALRLDLAYRLGFSSENDLLIEYRRYCAAIRTTYLEIMNN
ncbi:MAG: hypothetical protein AB1489_14550 [Acidobacteriota bacterium]